MLADAARIEQDDVGLALLVRDLVAEPAQRADDELAVEHVHLAADGFDEELFRHDGMICRFTFSREGSLRPERDHSSRARVAKLPSRLNKKIVTPRRGCGRRFWRYRVFRRRCRPLPSSAV